MAMFAIAFACISISLFTIGLFKLVFIHIGVVNMLLFLNDIHFHINKWEINLSTKMEYL